MRSVESFKGKREHNTSRLQKRVFVNQTDDSFSSRATNSRDPLYNRGKRVVGMSCEVSFKSQRMILLELYSAENTEALLLLVLVTAPVYFGWEGRNSRLMCCTCSFSSFSINGGANETSLISIKCSRQSGVEGDLALDFSCKQETQNSTTVFKSRPAVNDQLSEACI